MLRFPQGLTPAVRNVLLSTIFFSIMNALVKLLPRLPSHEIVCFRALVLLVCSFVLLRRAGLSPWGHRRGLLLLRGLTGTVALVLYFYTVKQMPLGSAVTIQYLSPVFTIFLGGLLLNEHARRLQWPFFVLALVGAVLIKGFDPRVSFVDLGAGMLSALFSGIAYTIVRVLRGSDHPYVVVFYFPLVTLPIVGVYTAAHWVMPSGIEWLILVGIGVAATAMQVCMTRAFHLDSAAKVSVFNYLGSLYAVATGYFIFDEDMTVMAGLGMCLIVVGVVFATRFGQSKQDKSSASCIRC